MKSPKLLIVTNSNYEFAKEDYKILSKSFETSYFVFDYKDIKTYFKLLKIYNYDIVYCWLAHYHSFFALFLSKIFRKRFVLHIGGHEVADIKEVGYGYRSKLIRYYAIKYSIEFADKVICANHKLKNKLLNIYKIASNKVIIIEHGFSFGKWQVKSRNKKENTIITAITEVNSLRRLIIKGIPLFIEVARIMPEYKFVIVGINRDKLLEYIDDLPHNLIIYGFMDQENLKKYYSKSKIYCQFSVSEGFGMALCEAMLCDCIPIVTNVGIMPEIIGNSGYVLEQRNAIDARNAINVAMYDNKSNPRKEITQKYDIRKRIQKLYKVILNENIISDASLG